MYSAPLHDSASLPHQKEREEWIRRLKERQETSFAAQPAPAGQTPFPPCPDPTPPAKPHAFSGDAALVGLILFLLSDRTKSDGILLCILVYLLLN